MVAIPGLTRATLASLLALSAIACRGRSAQRSLPRPAPRGGAAAPAPTRGAPTAAAGLRLAPRLVFEDVPAPVGFELIEQDVKGAGPTRVAVLIYQGRAELDQLAAFMARELQVAGWHARRRHQLLKERILSWEKERERCAVTLRPRDGGRVQLEIRVNNY